MPPRGKQPLVHVHAIGTPLGALTAQQLETIDLQTYGSDADPPSFVKNRIIDAQKQRALLVHEAERDEEVKVTTVPTSSIRALLTRVHCVFARTAP